MRPDIVGNIQRIKVFQIAILALVSSQIVAVDYCSLCRNHIACHNNGKFGRDCSSDRALVELGSKEKDYIVNLHDSLRNRIALGQIPRYRPAAKMPSFQWSDELAYLASLNAKTCRFEHDSCHSTVKFRWSGQNIARRGNSGGYENKYAAMKNMINDWFSEYRDADMSYINRYHGSRNGKQIGHFTVIVNDKNNAVGCAMVRHQAGGFKYNYLVCNYVYTNVIGRPVYEVGRTGSKCDKPNPVYKGLCYKNQKVNPRP